jgi:hypothetical protein
MGLRQAMASLDEMATNQPVRQRTRAAHAAALCDREGNMLCIAEDVGRHNALDRAIGKALLDGSLPNAALAVLSSRVSYEMVQKTARARIPMIFAVSRPTALTIVGATFYGVIGLFPNMFPSSMNPAWSLTAHNASSTQLTLTIMLVVVIIFVPIVLAYQAWAYNLFKTKVASEDLVY